MKNMSIKLKITLWYTLFMTLLVVGILWLLLFITNSRLLSNARLRLKDTVTRSFHEIDYEDGVLEFDNDINFLGEGIYISVYDAHGKLLYGRIPSLFFVLCIAAGGYFIIRRTLSPLADMTETAQKISSGNDLSRRIRLGAGNDEVHKMAHTFDKMMDKLEDSFENEKQFTSDVSHELRTPVTVILSQCEYALQEDTPAQEIKDCIRSIAAQARKMSNLISQLLTLARADKGTQKLHYELLNLSELAEIITEEQKGLASEKGITLETCIQPDILFRGDETMLMRLFINLISNSITYGKENGLTRISLSSDGNLITGSVSDNGIGIEKDKLDKIWKRFYQVNPARSSGEREGAGLGLPMVKWITEAHGGTVCAESTPGSGTVFTFTFPQNK